MFLPDLCSIAKSFKVVDGFNLNLDTQKEYCIARNNLPLLGEPGGFQIMTIHSKECYGTLRSESKHVIDYVVGKLRELECWERK